MIKYPLLIFNLIVLVVISSALATETCSLCGQPIHGKYAKYDDGQKFCIDCINKYPACSICKKPSRSTITLENKIICRTCLLKLETCSECKKPIIGKCTYYPESGLKLCEKCSRTIPKCDLCGRPEKNMLRIGDKYICKACQEQSAFCYLCGELIQGKYSWFDDDTTKKYCPKCINRYKRCANCGAPTGKNSTPLKDGRVLCRDCYKVAYFKPNRVSSIKQKVIKYLESALGMKIKHKIKYTLQGQDFIKQKSEGISGDINGLFYRLNDSFEIYVLYGLRKKDLYQVIPHEIAHAWTAENSYRILSLEEIEGFAQWVAYHTLGHFGYDDYRNSLLEGNTVYSIGLQMMLEIEERGGKKAVFDYIVKD